MSLHAFYLNNSKFYTSALVFITVFVKSFFCDTFPDYLHGNKQRQSNLNYRFSTWHSWSIPLTYFGVIFLKSSSSVPCHSILALLIFLTSVKLRHSVVLLCFMIRDIWTRSAILFFKFVLQFSTFNFLRFTLTDCHHFLDGGVKVISIYSSSVNSRPNRNIRSLEFLSTAFYPILGLLVFCLCDVWMLLTVS